MSKQAAQKRFTAARAPSSDLDPDERILGPVTAFNEMSEHARVSMITSRARSMQADGWQVLGSTRLGLDIVLDIEEN